MSPASVQASGYWLSCQFQAAPDHKRWLAEDTCPASQPQRKVRWVEAAKQSHPIGDRACTRGAGARLLRQPVRGRG